MKNLSSFFYSILAGVSISIGGTVFLSLDNKIVGSIFFSLGLFAVCTFGFNLFTGKVGYIFEQKPSYLLFLLQVWVGNLIGSLIVGYSLRLTRISGISEKAKALCDVKLGDSPLSIFILAIFCNILMFIAVDGFKTNQHEIGKYIGVFMCVIVFILCGFEHCVANMFYFSIAGVWNGHTILYLLIMTLGNACGGVLIPLARRLQNDT
ncbi:MAG: formate/nitrite transporter family protein [Firmicutes bacterium]|uniref:Formate/nitrite transporter family protein n=1 Tax=Candidatus Scybalomonas excrementavium TaxID=2840943 RepID=A0A9D9I124_9FIRM|nr:formate/nitrite transporter family protein [Candidatus Scybalomonas excrementavium]